MATPETMNQEAPEKKVTGPLTRNLLQTLHELTANVHDKKEIASENLKTVQDRFSTKVHTIVREGKNIPLTEKVLWDEVFYLGVGSQAGKVLSKEYPEVFEAFKKQDEAAEELKKFCITELGLDYTQLTLSDYLRMTEELVSIMIEEKTMSSRG